MFVTIAISSSFSQIISKWSICNKFNSFKSDSTNVFSVAYMEICGRWAPCHANKLHHAVIDRLSSNAVALQQVKLVSAAFKVDKSLKTVLEVVIRWNSIYLMTKKAIELYDSIETYVFAIDFSYGMEHIPMSLKREPGR